MTRVVIIGAYGSAGVAVADALADEPDVELVLADNGDPGGGLCILRGCMPSKDVYSAAAHHYQTRVDDRLPGDPPDVDLERVVATKDEHVSTFAAHRRAAVDDLADRENVTFRHETATLTGEGTVRIGEETVDADYVVVATGSTANVPDLPGLDSVPYRTSADVLDATEFGDSALVMGFGYIGLEMVPYLSEVGGMDVTVVEHDERPLDEADAPFGDELLDMYREEFDVDVLTNAYEQSVAPVGTGDTDEAGTADPTDEGVRLTYEQGGEERQVEADELYLFTGRRPALDGLGLDAWGVGTDDEWVGATMQARDDERVFVVGDANGREPILHVAKEQAQVAAANVLRHRDGESLVEYHNTHHHVVFSGLSVYPYARVGHSETSAAEAGLDAFSVTREASSDGVFKTKDTPRGLARLVVGEDGTVLGYQGLHYHADVMAKTMQVVVEGGLDVRTVPDRAYHPTTPEILDGLFREAKEELDVPDPTEPI
ncbi:FAD-dependent oxidoreductase [Halomarina oriensis]|uniref:NAD(P)/FAD-dependent oxidoreductase n=1 Tax=Halomarina oriensis TaxID=671145 RepID=A0A6B0GP69_9EURY|nr:NAD(P)/FAD-dependent oxidoreductase [Halomarina oriensis]MWG35771.1 NAD(P)/FAD-dependent oxidoreductase [Halomarina oriensis]